MSMQRCLNCGHRVSGEFCTHCGQKSDTARITPRSLIVHDILGAIWHVEARFFHTLKDILFIPGKMALDYISGKRIKYYNLFSMILILFGFNLIGLHFYEKLVASETLEETSGIREFFSKYSKTLLFIIIPVLAIHAFVLFKRIKLNIAEHIIIAVISHLGILILFLIDDIISIIGLYKPLSKIMDIIDKIIFAGIILFPAFTYINAFRKSFSKSGLFWRLLVLYFLMGVEVTFGIALFYKNI